MGRHGWHHAAARSGGIVNTTPPLTPEQRAKLYEFDDLLDSYRMRGTADAVEHPLHDALGDIHAAVTRPTPDTAMARRHIAAIENDIVRRRSAEAADARRLPAWLNPDGTFNEPQGETT